VTLTLTLDQVTRPTVLHYRPLSDQISFKLEKSYCGRTFICMDIETDFIRSTWSRKMNGFGVFLSVNFFMCFPDRHRQIHSRWPALMSPLSVISESWLYFNRLCLSAHDK